MSRSEVKIIPAIPKDYQVPVLEADVMRWVDDLFIRQDVGDALERRLQAGAAKYGTAWAEVNLTQDLREEILDAMNYVAMSQVRISATLQKPVQHAEYQAILRRAALYLEIALGIAEELPEMEGPSSKDWLPQHGIDPAEAQERFQDVVNGIDEWLS